MSREDGIKARLSELTALAQQRMAQTKYQTGMVYAGIFWLSDDEVCEHHNLVIELHALTKSSAADARDRIRKKIEKRLEKRLQSAENTVY